MIKRLIAVFLAIIQIFSFSTPASAQTSGDLPVYIVQPGDSLNLIAVRFGISAEDLIAVNDLVDPNVLNVGTALRIPGLEGFSGTLTTDVAGLGATLTGLSRLYQFSRDLIVNLNRITSPAEIYVGSTLVLPLLEETTALQPAAPIHTGDSLLETAVKQNQNPWVILETNTALGSAALLPLERLVAAAASETGSILGSDLVQSVDINPLPLRQGKTEVITVKTTGPASLSGELNGKPLNFFQVADNEYAAIQGVHSLARPGLTGIKVQVEAAGVDPFTIEQSILVESGFYVQDPPLYVDPETIDAVFTKPEDDRIREITTPATPDRYWVEIFKQPVDEPACIKSWYGNRRSYNGSPFDYFHSGVDYGVCANLNIYAPAPGRVVFSGELTVRGIATIIDHGWGIYSGMYHQSKTLVKVGDFVEAGQLIGEIGGTGRVTGPHLHWEVFANGIQVEPLDWLDHLYPEDFLPAP
ncbi:MAG: LysM peptidoglycan-binding domain-containing M23 family metallopeptidase [Bellilinea sp.]